MDGWDRGDSARLAAARLLGECPAEPCSGRIVEYSFEGGDTVARCSRWRVHAAPGG